jgi:hypothetical protein
VAGEGGADGGENAANGASARRKAVAAQAKRRHIWRRSDILYLSIMGGIARLAGGGHRATLPANDAENAVAGGGGDISWREWWREIWRRNGETASSIDVSLVTHNSNARWRRRRPHCAARRQHAA